jgi:molybdate/tungstate transport system substrate-binding protein
VLALGALLAGAPAAAQRGGSLATPHDRLTVFSAGSLARPLRALLDTFRLRNPGVDAALEVSGSLEAVRKLTDLGRTPDLLALADERLARELLLPAYADWYAAFAASAMVLAYTPVSTGADAIGPDDWWRVLLRPGVRTGRSDPALDPAGYRALIVGQLAERHYGRPGLAGRLARAVHPGDVRPKSADLLALLQSGELDYAWEYEAVARMHGLRYVALPGAVSLGDSAHAADYERAAVRVPGLRRGAPAVEVRGAPIVFVLTVPRAAAQRSLAERFAGLVLSPTGAAVLRAYGFRVPGWPLVTGAAPPIILRATRPIPTPSAR